MPICRNVLQGLHGPVLCVNKLTKENLRRGHHLCDRCSGREAANLKLARPKPVFVDGYEQLELFREG